MSILCFALAGYMSFLIIAVGLCQAARDDDRPTPLTQKDSSYADTH